MFSVCLLTGGASDIGLDRPPDLGLGYPPDLGLGYPQPPDLGLGYSPPPLTRLGTGPGTQQVTPPPTLDLAPDRLPPPPPPPPPPEQCGRYSVGSTPLAVMLEVLFVKSHAFTRFTCRFDCLSNGIRQD